MSGDNDQKDAYISTKLQLRKPCLSFIHKIISLTSAASVLFRSPLTYRTTASLDKLTCTHYRDFRKNQDRFGKSSLSKKNSNYLDVKLKVSKRDDNKEFQLVQNLPKVEADFNRFMRLKKQPVIAAKNLARKENLSPVVITTLSIDMNEQLKLPHKVVQTADRANRKVCVTLLQYKVEKPETSYAQVRIIARMKEYEKFHQSLCQS